MKYLVILLIPLGMSVSWASTLTGAGPLIIAHRGASHDAPENTLAAFRLAWEQGADGIEADFFLTKDGRIVCLHDATTKRTAGVDLPIAETNWDRLQPLDVGSWKGERWAGERIPLIEQLFELVPEGKKIYVEVKCGPEIIPALERAIAESKLKNEQIVIISFKESVIAESKRRFPEIKANWLVAYHKDKTNGVWKPAQDEILATLKRSKADGLGTEANREVVDAQFVRRLRSAGYELHTWTVDDPDKARHFRGFGVDSIITNRPAFIRERLQ
jgi:glycerophosphoryl diester phosphodiesterase